MKHKVPRLVAQLKPEWVKSNMDESEDAMDSPTDDLEDEHKPAALELTTINNDDDNDDKTENSVDDLTDNIVQKEKENDNIYKNWEKWNVSPCRRYNHKSCFTKCH